MLKLAKMLSFGIATAIAVPAAAAPITSAVGTYYAFPDINAFGAGPQTFSGITWSSTNASNQGGSVFGYSGGYGFGPNGTSNQTLVGLNDSSNVYGVADSMQFAFAAPVSAVGAVINWYPNTLPVTISIYDAANNLLESQVLSVGEANTATPNSFHGFQSSSANISRFVMTDGYIAAIGGLNVLSSSVPEPATWGLMILGCGAVGASMRRKRYSAKVAFA